MASCLSQWRQQAIINKALCHSMEDNALRRMSQDLVTGNAQDIYPWSEFENYW